MAEGKNTEKLRAALERIRVTVRDALGPKEQMRFLNFIDAIQQEVLKERIQAEAVNGPIMRAKAGTRKTLREDPLAMAKLLNGFEIFEEELMRALAELEK